MMRGISEVLVSVNPSEPDDEYRDELAQELASDLRDVEGIASIQEKQDRTSKAGAKGMFLEAGLLVIGGIAVTANMVTIVDVMGKWLNRDKGRRTLSLTIQGDSFTIEDLDEKTQKELIAWLKARAER